MGFIKMYRDAELFIQYRRLMCHICHYILLVLFKKKYQTMTHHSEMANNVALEMFIGL